MPRTAPPPGQPHNFRSEALYVGHLADPPLLPSVFSDAQGVFLFEDIPPGHYFLFSRTWKSSWDDPSGAMHIFELLPGGTTDLGQISVDH